MDESVTGRDVDMISTVSNSELKHSDPWPLLISFSFWMLAMGVTRKLPISCLRKILLTSPEVLA